MKNELPPFWAERERPDTPAFIQPIPEMHGLSDAPCKLFNFWCPVHSRDPATDFEAGRRHCQTALAYAHVIGGIDVIANIVGSMRYHGAGPMEVGFLDALASKAVCGRVPPPISDEFADTTSKLSGRTVKEMRFGEGEACEYIELARLRGSPVIIRELMASAVNQEMGYGALTFIWTVCGAALTGSAS